MGATISLQFGNTYQRPAPGRVLLSRVYTSPCHLWLTEVEESASLGVEDPLLEGFVCYRRPAEFAIGLPDGEYRITLTCYEPTADHGPFTVKAGDQTVLSDLAISAATRRDESFAARAVNGVLHLEFIPAPGKDFLLNGLVVEGPEGVVPQPVFKSAPPPTLPTPTELSAHGEADPELALRRICDWLVEHRRADGFLGDTWHAGGSHWYTVSMPARALLAGYDLFGDARYLDVVFTVLDRFVEEQLPDGAWTTALRGKPTADLSPTEVENIIERDYLPTSGTGSIVSALAVASRHARSPRREAYVGAIRRFCDGWVMQFQQPSGGFTEDPKLGPHTERVYTCSTAIEAATFCLAAAVTGKNDYLSVADSAMRFLLPDWREDGRMVGRAPHWMVRSQQPFVMETLYFGDQWYYDEGFITVGRHTRDAELRRALNHAIHRRVFGERGLLRALDNRAWWPIQDIWNNAKSIGMVQTLLHERACGRSTPALDDALVKMTGFLCAPEYARRVGIMSDDVERPAAMHGYHTWSGMRMEATGFAGMTLAEMLKPGILYLA